MSKEVIKIRVGHGSLQDPKEDSCLIVLLDKYFKKEIDDEKLSEQLNDCLLKIDRILIRNYLDSNYSKEIFIDLFRESNKAIKEEICDNHFLIMDLASEHDLLWPESCVRNFFELTPHR